MLDKYRSPYWDMHRADLQLTMYERAKTLGVRFQFGTLVKDVDLNIPMLTTEGGQMITGDLVLAADGGTLSTLPSWSSLTCNRTLVQYTVQGSRKAKPPHTHGGSCVSHCSQDRRHQGSRAA